MRAGRRIVVVGSYMRDLVMRVDVFPQPGETRLGYGHFSTDGGKGSNQAVQAARCGAEVAMIAAIGDDANGRAARDLWSAEGIDASAVLVRGGAATGVAMILVAADGQNQIVVDAGANLTLAPDDIDRSADLIRGAALVVAQLEVPRPAVARAFALARAAAVPTLLNIAPAPEEPVADLLRLTDILVANEVEAAALAGSGAFDAERARDMTAALGVATFVLTAGADGASLFAKDGAPLSMKPPAVGEIVDTTGAGDAFIGAFAAHWADTGDMTGALRRGLTAGSLACTRRGAVSSLPGLDEVLRLAP